MKILFLTAGDLLIASSRTRVFQYLPYLSSNNIKYSILIYNKSGLGRYRLYAHKCYVLFQLLILAPFFDVIFVQKVLLHPTYFKVLKFLNCIIVYDFDDAIYTNLNDVKQKTQNENRFAYTVTNSKLVVLENETAKEYARAFNEQILQITGPIDINRYKRDKSKRHGDLIIIGWIGSSSTTGYLDSIRSVLERILAKYPNVFVKTIGASDDFSLSRNYIHVKWDLATEVKELEDVDIGLMPLPDDEWTRCKGGYKLLQYMSMGIPSIASAVGINNILIQNEVNGFLASNEEIWYEKLSYLIDNLENLSSIGDNARSIAEKQYSYEIYAPVLINNIKHIVLNKSE